KKRHPRRGATLSGFTCYAIPSLLLPCRSISGKGFRRTFRLVPRRSGLHCPSLGGCCAVSFRIPRRESCRRWSCEVRGELGWCRYRAFVSPYVVWVDPFASYNIIIA